MTDVSPASFFTAGRVEQRHADPQRRPIVRHPDPLRQASDRVELSARSRYLAQLRDLPAVRAELVDRVRQEIASGRYDTPTRFEQALEHLPEDLDFIA